MCLFLVILSHHIDRISSVLSSVTVNLCVGGRKTMPLSTVSSVNPLFNANTYKKIKFEF